MEDFKIDELVLKTKQLIKDDCLRGCENCPLANRELTGGRFYDSGGKINCAVYGEISSWSDGGGYNYSVEKPDGTIRLPKCEFPKEQVIQIAGSFVDTLIDARIQELREKADRLTRKKEKILHGIQFTKGKKI